MKSLLLDIIENHPSDWVTYLGQNYPEIKIKKDENRHLAIFNYGIQSRFEDPVVQEARGIIIDYVNLQVVCWPFRKFGNYRDSYADKIDWESARVEAKIDGSIIKVWWDDDQKDWQVSTNSMIDARDAKLPEGSLYPNFYEMFRAAENYGNILWDQMNKLRTYIFELVSPGKVVVINYKTTKIYHIGTRGNLTGTEIIAYIGIPHPKSYDLHSLDQCIQYASELNKGQEEKITHVEDEGFVVVDKDWHRIKIKSPIYVALHTLTSKSTLSKSILLSMIRRGSIDVQAVCSDFPELSHWIKYYDYRWTEFMIRGQVFINITRQIYRELGEDRKAVAMRISKNPLAAYGFMALKNQDMTFKDLVDSLPENKVYKMIPDYVPEDLSYMFNGVYNK